MKKYIPLLFLAVSVFLAACQNGLSLPEASATVAAVAPSIMVTPSPTTAATHPPTAMSTTAPTAVLNTPTPIPTVTSSALPTATAEATPVSLQTLAIPPDLEAEFRTLFANLQINAGWQAAVAEDPQLWVSDGRAAAAILINGSGELFAQRPQILAIPLFTDWETSSLAEAERILQEGHPLVTVQFWSQLTAQNKALRIDGYDPADPAYPLQQRLSLFSPAPVDPQLRQLLQDVFTPPATAHLAAVGDIMLDRALGNAIRAGQIEFPFARVQEMLQNADYTVGNMESALGDVGTPEEKRYPFQAPPEAARALALGGFDLVSLANNHGMDYGPEALRQALSLLDAAGVAALGAGLDSSGAHTPVRASINGIEFAFLGYVNVPVEVSGFDTAVWTAGPDSPGLAWGTLDAITADVAAVRDQVDHVVVLLHSGYEYVEPPSEAQIALSRAAIDAGAALVIGHHAHVLQGIEFYNDGIIAYGLGNFAFEIDGPPETVILNIWFDKDGVRELALTPAVIQFGGQPRPADPAEAAVIRRIVVDRSRYFGPTPPFP
jgi:poly-gamma-glutamate capsule biosynthesis protein CapA/YwtB (metallophosphatase superfamily)